MTTNDMEVTHCLTIAIGKPGFCQVRSKFAEEDVAAPKHNSLASEVTFGFKIAARPSFDIFKSDGVSSLLRAICDQRRCSLKGNNGPMRRRTSDPFHPAF